MSKHLWSTVLPVLFIGVNGIAGDGVERDKLVGLWASEDAGSTSSGWNIESNNDSFKITEIRAANIVADYVCKADGRECEIKTAGKKATLSMYFNGPKLVQLETQGPNVIKRRFLVLQGDAMELEIIPIVPDGKPETIRFKRVQLGSAGK